MKVGDRVTVVHGLDDPSTMPGVIKSGPRTRANAVLWLVEFDKGGEWWTDATMIDLGVVRLGPGRHRVTDPETARMAAEAVGEHLTEYQWATLAALVEAGSAGLIDHEHEGRSGLIPTSAGKRRKELERLGLVEEIPGAKRLTANKRYAQVHRVTARGIAVWQLHERGAA